MNRENDLKVLRHSAAHLLAHAATELFPGIKLTIGPATDDGFFYDMLPLKNFKEEDLEVIENKMRELASKNYPITHKEISKAEARKLYKDNPFKLELIDSIEGDTVGLSCQGDFCDLCRGGHVKSTGEIKHFKLLSVAGSYWRADKNRQALQRIYGTAFFTKEELDNFLKSKEDALNYDHRKIGRQFDLFSFDENGPGFPFFHPKGKIIFDLLVDYMKSIYKSHNYQEIMTPMLLSDELWKRSGHYAFYKPNMYFCMIDDRSFAIKPMNCPGAILTYQTRPRSYRELPLKLSEFGRVHRHELSGVLHGLFRTRAFTIDDTHAFCTIGQIEDEVKNMIMLTLRTLKKFGFENVKIKLATRPEKAMGSQELWNSATNALRNALDKSEYEYEIIEGEGAFYGPKIEFHMQDSLSRSWQCGTIQLDFMQPENFDLWYINSAGTKERPVIIHQAIYGSLERFMAILLEHHKGHLPFYLSPIQIIALTITDKQMEYAGKVVDKLKSFGLRATIDQSSDQISGKIRNAQMEKIPWMLVIGQKEVDTNSVTLRLTDGTQKPGLTIDDLIFQAKELIIN